MNKAAKLVALYLAAIILAYLGLGIGLQRSIVLAYTIWAITALLVVYGTYRIVRR